MATEKAMYTDLNVYGYGKFKLGNPVPQSGISLLSSSGGSKAHTSLHKKIIPRKKNSKCPFSRKVKKLNRKLENSDRRTTQKFCR